MGTIDATARLKDQSVGDPQAIKSIANLVPVQGLDWSYTRLYFFIGKLEKHVIC